MSTLNHGYPKQYKGPKPIKEQIKAIASIFQIDPRFDVEFVNNLPKPPEGAEGWFAFPKISALAKKYFPEIEKDKWYCEAVKLVHKKLAERGNFYKYVEDEIQPNKLRQREQTIQFLELLESEYVGNIIVIPAQCGMRYRNKSVRKTRKGFSDGEFGLGMFHVGCMALVHPERYTCPRDLGTDCAGDEISSNSGTSFKGCAVLRFRFDQIGFGNRWIKIPVETSGSASAFVV